MTGAEKGYKSNVGRALKLHCSNSEIKLPVLQSRDIVEMLVSKNALVAFGSVPYS